MTDPTNTPRVAPAQEQTAHRAPTDPSEISLPSLNTKLINEIVAHIIRHDGPDPQGRAHPTRKKLPLAEVEAALDVVKQQKALSELRPYHMSPVPTGCWGNATLANEVLKKKCDALLRDTFKNDLVDFCTQITEEDLLTPLTETIGGKVLAVSMGKLAHSFGDSPYKIVKHYLTLIGKDTELADFKPYHMSKTTRGTWAEQTTRDAVLKKKCDALLRENFNNDLVDFCTKVTVQDLLTPLTETLGGKVVEVSMGSLSISFGDSPYEMLKRYHRLTGRSFPYTKACFVGPPETRSRRQRGDFSVEDLRKIRQPDGTFNTAVFGLKNFNTQDKVATRELMLEMAELELEDRSINYLGLETEQFHSLRAVYQRLNLSPEGSRIVERDNRVFKAMQSTVAKLPHGEGKALRAVSLSNNTLQQDLEALPIGASEFNLVNFDYLGHLERSKEHNLQLLLERRLLATKALVIVTLQNSPLAQARARKEGYSTDQAQALLVEMTRLGSLTGHQVHQIAALPYKGGSDATTRDSEMLWIAYRITRENPCQS